jgi:hypothetical protein
VDNGKGVFAFFGQRAAFAFLTASLRSAGVVPFQRFFASSLAALFLDFIIKTQ